MFWRGVNATADSGRCDFQIKNVCARLKVRLFIVDRILNVVASVVSGNPVEILEHCLNLLVVSKAGICSPSVATVSTDNPSIDPYCSQKSSSDLKILGARRVIYSSFHTEGPQISDDTIQNIVAQTTWGPAFVHPCCVVYTKHPTNLLPNFRWLCIGLSEKCINTSSNCMYYIIHIPSPVAAGLQGLWLRIPPGSWMSVFCVLGVGR